MLSGGKFSSASTWTAGADLIHEGSHLADYQSPRVHLAALRAGPAKYRQRQHPAERDCSSFAGAAYASEHGGVQSSTLFYRAPLTTPGLIGAFLNAVPSGNPPYRAYPGAVLRSPIDPQPHWLLRAGLGYK